MDVSHFNLGNFISGDGKVLVDWEFLELIYSRREEMPHLISDKERKSFEFDPANYQDDVVMPWYRNQDQPQVNNYIKSKYFSFFVQKSTSK